VKIAPLFTVNFRILDKTGIGFGKAVIGILTGLVHPLTVCVTVCVPVVVTFIEEVVAPLFHNNAPLNEAAVIIEYPQKLLTDTRGAGGIAIAVSITALEFTVPALFFHTARYCLLLSAVVTTKFNVLLVAPGMFIQDVPWILDCHCTVGAGLPLAAELNVTFFPAHTVCADGCVVTTGPVLTVLLVNTTSTQ
jgi:hypothetical protein